MRRRVAMSMLASSNASDCGERPLESLRVNFLLPRGEVVFGQRGERLLINALQSLALRAKRRVESAGRRGNRLQARLVKVRLHELAGIVFHEAAALILPGAESNRRSQSRRQSRKS